MDTRGLTVDLALPGGTVRVEMDVPMGEVPMERLLPALRTTADAFVAYGAEMSAAAGKPVSCAKGCGACCRQLIPLAHAEARAIAALVEELPEPRRSEMKERFEDALRRVEAAGLLPSLEGSTERMSVEAIDLGLGYMRLGIPCPFLEDESCSIYSERPIACREYLVSSLPRHCASPTAETVEAVSLPTRVWAAAAREEKGVANSDPAPCVPLVVALRWAATASDAAPLRPGPDILQKVYARFARDRRGEGFGR
ncbi:MAG: YkgJ family cysteine cluster protein [Deltaproteobacteria bacterium]|nr:YkgJ family cysteine cluster protein [Deltaproteobacteria bacterium]